MVHFVNTNINIFAYFDDCVPIWFTGKSSILTFYWPNKINVFTTSRKVWTLFVGKKKNGKQGADRLIILKKGYNDIFIVFDCFC